jgi:uncharacterized MnhB-related membrane protein
MIPSHEALLSQHNMYIKDIPGITALLLKDALFVLFRTSILDALVARSLASTDLAM